MTTTPALYPVDSRYMACCHAIGRHAPDCRATAISQPSGRREELLDEFLEVAGTVPLEELNQSDLTELLLILYRRSHRGPRLSVVKR